MSSFSPTYAKLNEVKIDIRLFLPLVYYQSTKSTIGQSYQLPISQLIDYPSVNQLSISQLSINQSTIHQSINYPSINHLSINQYPCRRLYHRPACGVYERGGGAGSVPAPRRLQPAAPVRPPSHRPGPGGLRPAPGRVRRASQDIHRQAAALVHSTQVPEQGKDSRNLILNA